MSTPSSPFVPTTTPTIERANRLIAVRTHPGFLDVLRLSRELVEEATKTANTYPGWDKDQLFVLHTRAKVAMEHYDALLRKIQEAIETGLEEEKQAQQAAGPAKTPEDVVEQGDHVRRLVLQKFDGYDSRPSGSY